MLVFVLSVAGHHVPPRRPPDDPQAGPAGGLGAGRTHRQGVPGGAAGGRGGGGRGEAEGGELCGHAKCGKLNTAHPTTCHTATADHALLLHLRCSRPPTTQSCIPLDDLPPTTYSPTDHPRPPPPPPPRPHRPPPPPAQACRAEALLAGRERDSLLRENDKIIAHYRKELRSYK